MSLIPCLHLIWHPTIRMKNKTSLFLQMSPTRLSKNTSRRLSRGKSSFTVRLLLLDFHQMWVHRLMSHYFKQRKMYKLCKRKFKKNWIRRQMKKYGITMRSLMDNINTFCKKCKRINWKLRNRIYNLKKIMKVLKRKQATNKV